MCVCVCVSVCVCVCECVCVSVCVVQSSFVARSPLLSSLLGKHSIFSHYKFVTGQVIFSSGWEWGYWLSDVVAAEAAWDPRVSHPQGGNGSTPRAILASIVADVLASSLGENASVVGAWVADIAHAQVRADMFRGCLILPIDV